MCIAATHASLVCNLNMLRLGRETWRVWHWPATLCATAFGLAYAYLFPASEWLLTGKQPAKILGNGVDDIQGLVWSYRAIVRTLYDHPTRYFFGAIHTELRNTPEGAMLWVPWVERIFVPILAPFTTDATLVTAMDFAFYLTSFAAMCLYGREMQWSKPVLAAGAIAFAFSPFARARAAVHPAFVAVYFIPLLFLAIERVARQSRDPFGYARWKWPALMLLLVGTVAHYYLLITLLLTPFLLLYALSRARTFGGSRLVVLARLALCSLPLVLFLAWNFLAAVPPGVHIRAGNFPIIEAEVNNHYLHTFSALPIDYVTGDVGYDPLADLIVPRRALSAFVAANGPGNPHERTNGIRWTVLALAALAVASAVLSKLNARKETRNADYVLLIALVAAYGLMMSMGPQWLVFQGKEYGPSQFAMKLFPNLRVASRWGPVVNFGVISAAMGGLMGVQARLAQAPVWWRRVTLQSLLWLVPVLATAEYFPRSRVIMATLPPVVPGLPTERGDWCGVGMFLPHVQFDLSQFETTRGTSCRLLQPNSTEEGMRLERFLVGTPAAWRTPAMRIRFAELVKCTGMSWVVFRPGIDAQGRTELCNELGWTMSSDQVCRTTQPPATLSPADNCVPK